MTDTNATPTPTPPRGYRVIQVREFTNKKGKVIAAHTRTQRKRLHPRQSTRDPISHRPIAQPKPASVPPYPYPRHARHLHEQLAVPLALLTGMQINNLEYRVDIVRRAIDAIEQARTFIDRFAREWVPDEQQIQATADFNRKYPNPK